ncbi:m7GpppN-mRNA hydrolase-like [Bolinopsis microptera]|uniref:m7GpppN-mRNA hydrolase-like n=1 Tax=Bolinopsis microptera TaxID=2820187 RepID=UPI00307A2352
MVNISEDILNDIFSRFIIPEAKSNCNDPIRLCFAIEMGHWFYLDYIRPSDPTLPDCSVEVFAKACFRHMPSLLQPHREANLVLKQWRDFKRKVPVYGAMLITPDRKQVLLVEGNSTRDCWTFPRGKIEEDEDPFDCAIREVREETSFDISSLADRNYYIEKVCSDRRVRLYIVHDVPQTTVFYTKVRGEIANIDWFPVDELPGASGFKKKKESFFMVNQFIREYVRGYRTGKKRNNASECERSRPRGTSFNDGDNSMQYTTRRDPGHEGDYRHNTREHRQERPDHHNNRSRDSRSRDHFKEHGYVSEPPAPHRGLYSQDLSSRNNNPQQQQQPPYSTQRADNTSSSSRNRMRGGRNRRGNPATARGFPGPPDDMRLSNFRFDMDTLIDMLPEVPNFTAVRS